MDRDNSRAEGYVHWSRDTYHLVMILLGGTGDHILWTDRLIRQSALLRNDNEGKWDRRYPGWGTWGRKTIMRALAQRERDRAGGGQSGSSTPGDGPQTGPAGRGPAGAADGQARPHAADPYAETPGGIVWNRPTNNGPVAKVLTNFTARIVEDRIEDDAVTQRHLFAIDAARDGQVSRFVVPAERFTGMTWVLDSLGPEAVVTAGQNVRDHARAAIQMLSGRIPKRYVYAHLGWRKIDGQWTYLHVGGGIAATGEVAGLDITLPDDLQRFVLRLPPSDAELRQAIRAVLAFSDLAPRRVSVVVSAAAQRALFGPSGVTAHIIGRTGVGKTALGALGQQHYGPDMTADHLAASWLSTGNALERLGFFAKDAVLLIDDFVPTGGDRDAAQAHQKAERLIRAQGNQIGRQRMTADTRLRSANASRALILSTGEEVPRGQSLRARIVLTELRDGALDWSALGACQADAAKGLYAQATAAHIQWIAARYDELHDQLPAVRAALRDQIFAAHPRTPTTVADLALGWGSFLGFASDVGAITTKEAQARWGADWAVLVAVAAEQDVYQRAGDPVGRYLDTLGAAIASGRAHVADCSGDPPGAEFARWGWTQHEIGAGEYKRTEWHPHGDRVGWLDGDDLYLEPDVSVAVARRLAGETGDYLTVLPNTLHRLMRDRGLLVTIDKARGTLTVRRTMEGREQSVLHIRTEIVWGLSGVEKPDETDETGPPPAGFGWGEGL
jgi:hypothetical protein